ncbi:hypothetical protein [Terricaulis sp.]|uniref:hypothetical protein n=1 Tax=Terricaulis sp. TaxID=2768686 RepID=UPI003783D619
MAPKKTYIHKLNIVRFETLLLREKDSAKCATLERLLSDERALLDAAVRRDKQGNDGAATYS